MRAQADPASLATLATRRVSRGALAIAATVWAGSLVVLGLWLVFSVARMWSMFALPAVLGGVTAVVMGQFVFSYLVADRLFPGAARIIGWRLEIGSVVLFVAGLCSVAWALLASG